MITTGDSIIEASGCPTKQVVYKMVISIYGMCHIHNIVYVQSTNISQLYLKTFDPLILQNARNFNYTMIVLI